MDEQIECRSLYFLVSILRGIIFYSNRGNYILASRWLTIYLFCYFRMKKLSVVVCSRSQYGFLEEYKWFKKLKFRNFMINIKKNNIEMFINQIRAPLFFFSQSPRFSDLQIAAIGKRKEEQW
jgi:hypothetical protein